MTKWHKTPLTFLWQLHWLSNWSCWPPVSSFPPILQSDVLSKMQIWPCPPAASPSKAPYHLWDKSPGSLASNIRPTRRLPCFLLQPYYFPTILVSLQQHWIIGRAYTSHAATLNATLSVLGIPPPLELVSAFSLLLIFQGPAQATPSSEALLWSLPWCSTVHCGSCSYSMYHMIWKRSV